MFANCLCSGNQNLSGKAHVIPAKVGDSEQHVAPFEPVKVKLLALKLLPHLQIQDSTCQAHVKPT